MATRTQFFIVRAWREDEGFRARIIYTVDIESFPAKETEVVTADSNEVQQHLASWLAAIAGPR
jgi:hypothetical protein